MTRYRTILLSGACGALIATSAWAQTTNTAQPKPVTANTPSPLTTPGSMNNTMTFNPSTGAPYPPQVNLTDGPIAPAITSINPSTGQPYQPQVNMNGPATNNPDAGGNNISAQPPVTTPSATTQPNTLPTAPPLTAPPQLATPQ